MNTPLESLPTPAKSRSQNLEPHGGGFAKFLASALLAGLALACGDSDKPDDSSSMLSGEGTSTAASTTPSSTLSSEGMPPAATASATGTGSAADNTGGGNT